MYSRKFGSASSIALIACYGLFAGLARGEDGLWTSDFTAAKAKAKAEKKLLLLDFTGSDWCVWCKKLHAEVFDLDAFKNEAPKKFVLVELDFPHGKELPPEVKEQNSKLQQEFKVAGFPTIMVTDAEGRAVAKTGYKAGGAEKYMESLNGIVTAHGKIVVLQGKLGATKGIERAKMLDEILTLQETLGTESDDGAKYSEEILTLDADNKAGLKSKYTFKKMLDEAKELIAGKKLDEAKTTYEKALTTPGISGELKQEGYFGLGGLAFQQRDFAAVVENLTKARDAAPKTEKAAQLETMIKRYGPIADAQGAVNKAKTAADAAKGPERAKALDQQVTALTKFNTLMPSRTGPAEIEKLSQEIVTLDADNKAGLKTKYEAKVLVAEATKAMRAKDFEKAEADLTKALALPGLPEDQKAAIMKAQNDMEAQKGKGATPAKK